MLAMIDLLLLRIPFKSKFVLQTKSHDDTGQYVDLIEICKFSGCARFIPVYTGNTNCYLNLYSRNPVYPCVYREHQYIELYKYLDGGLSLCIQGTHQSHQLIASDQRFIPVYTGNTNHGVIPNLGIAVYPCVYREHAALKTKIDSSNRFIPVYTGNTGS